MPTQLADLLTVGGLTVMVAILVEVIKRGAALSAAAVDRWGPALALGLGVVVGGAVAIYQRADLGQAVLTGVLAGASAMGLSDISGTLTTTPAAK